MLYLAALLGFRRVAITAIVSLSEQEADRCPSWLNAVTRRKSHVEEVFYRRAVRTSHASAGASNGVHPKVMQELAGHYSSQITMDIYTHVNMDAKREAVAAVSKVF